MEASPLEMAVRAWYEADIDKARGFLSDSDFIRAKEMLRYRVMQTLAVLRESMGDSEVPTTEQIERAQLESDLRGIKEFANDEEHGPLPEAMKLGLDFMKETIEAQLDPSKPMPDSLELHARLRKLDADAGEPPAPQEGDAASRDT